MALVFHLEPGIIYSKKILTAHLSFCKIIILITNAGKSKGIETQTERDGKRHPTDTLSAACQDNFERIVSHFGAANTSMRMNEVFPQTIIRLSIFPQLFTVSQN